MVYKDMTYEEYLEEYLNEYDQFEDRFEGDEVYTYENTKYLVYTRESYFLDKGYYIETYKNKKVCIRMEDFDNYSGNIVEFENIRMIKIQFIKTFGWWWDIQKNEYYEYDKKGRKLNKNY